MPRRWTLRNRARWGGVLVCAAGVGWGCEAAAGLPDEAPTIVGVIESVTQPLPGVGGGVAPTPIYLAGEEGSCGVELLVTADTRIVLSGGSGEVTRGGYSDLAIGKTVRAWTMGAVSSECPRQATAEVIEVVD